MFIYSVLFVLFLFVFIFFFFLFLFVISIAIDLSLDGADMKTSPAMQDVDFLSISSGNNLQCQQRTRKLCCPDCNGGKLLFSFGIILCLCNAFEFLESI